MVLLDTNALLWSALGDHRLGEQARGLIDQARDSGELFLSPISAWEIAMLVDKGRFRLNLPVQAWIAQAVRGHDLQWATLTGDIAAGAGILPGSIHGDPADRMIIAAARALGCAVLTADRKILAYARAGHVRAIDARD